MDEKVDFGADSVEPCIVSAAAAGVAMLRIFISQHTLGFLVAAERHQKAAA